MEIVATSLETLLSERYGRASSNRRQGGLVRQAPGDHVANPAQEPACLLQRPALTSPRLPAHTALLQDVSRPPQSVIPPSVLLNPWGEGQLLSGPSNASSSSGIAENLASLRFSWAAREAETGFRTAGGELSA